MKSIIWFGIFFMLLTSCHNEDPIRVKSGALIHNITIISADNDNVKSYKGFVVIDGDKIIYANKKKPELIGNFKRINGKGKFIIPGLIDSHVHLANTAGFNGQLKNKYPGLVDVYFEQLPKSYLYHGFTTLIDVNNYAPQIIDRIESSPLHPDIYTCGSQVLLMDGFMMEMEEYTPEIRYQSNFLHDKYNKEIVFPDSIDLAEHTTKKIISNITKQRGVGVKLAYEDEASGLRVTWTKPSKSIIMDLVSEAQKYSLPVLLHAPSLEGHQAGLEAGVTIFAHGLWNWTDNFEEDFNSLELSATHKEVLAQIAEKQIAYQLTFRTITGEQDLILRNFDSNEHLENIYPKALLAVLQSEEGAWGRNKILGRSAFLKRTNPPFYKAMRADHTSDEMMWEAVYELYKSRLNIVAKYLFDANANFILGSDTPAMNMFTNPPGYNGYLEMVHMNEAGLSLEAIFRAATVNNAKVFHLEGTYGSIEVNKKANLLILKSNPLKNIKAYNDIEMVIIGGEVLAREDLSATQLGIK